MKVLSFAILCSLLCVQSAFAANRALIIGVGDYFDPKITPLPDPGNDVRMSRRIAQSILGFKHDEIEVLQGEGATRENILATFDDWLIDESDPGDKIYFYFSGHGAQITDDDGDEEGPGGDGADEVILPYDTQQLKHSLRNHITDDELNERFKKLANRHVIAIFDSCNSGTVTRGLGGRQRIPVKTIPTGEFSNPTQAFINTLDPGTITSSDAFKNSRNDDPFISSTKQRTVWSAASSTQLAYADESGSKFTQLLYEGTFKEAQNKTAPADRNSNGIVTNSELLSFVKIGSQQFCAELKKSGKCHFGLTPELSIAGEQYSMPFGFPSQNTSQVAAGHQGAVTSDALPEQQPEKLSLILETIKGQTNSVPLNDKIYVTVQNKGDQSGYLYLFDHDEAGDVRLLYPGFGEDNQIGRDQKKLIPDPRTHLFEIQAFKSGQSELVAIIVEDPIDTSQLTSQIKRHKPVSSKQLGNFVSKIQATYVGDRVNRAVNYAIKRLPYTVK